MRTLMLFFAICIERDSKTRNRNWGFTSAKYILPAPGPPWII